MKRNLIALVFGIFSAGLMSGCWPRKESVNVVWDTPAVPISFRVWEGAKECEFGWLRFEAEYEYDTSLTKEMAWNVVRECSVPIGSAKFVAEAILAPKIAAADAGLQLSACVVSKASKHLTFNRIRVGANSGDWGNCL